MSVNLSDCPTCADCKFYHATRASDGEVVYWRECQRCPTTKLTGDEHARAIREKRAAEAAHSWATSGLHE